MAKSRSSSSLLLLVVMAVSVFVAVLPHYVPIIAYAAPNPSQRREQQAVTPRPTSSSSSTEAAAAGVGGVESGTPNNNGDEYESRGGATTVRSFATMSSGTASTDINNTVPVNEGEASMECNQAKELGNVQDVLTDYYPKIAADGYYFCSKTAPADFYCYCGVASVCHEFKDPWGRDVGECGCCTQWVYILFGIFMGVVGIVFLCGMFACLCHGTWLYDGHPRPITPLLPQRTAPVIAPAAFPLPANAFRGYRASDFTTAGGGTDQQQPTPTSNATTRPQSPRITSPSSQSAATRARSPLPPTSPISPRGGHHVDEEGGTELEQRGLAVASGTHRYSSASAATTPPPPTPLPSNSQTNNTSPTDEGRTSSSRSRGGGGWVYDSDGNLLVEEDEEGGGGGQFSARSGTTAAAAAQSDSRRTTTYSPSTSHEHHLPVSPTTAQQQSATAAPRTNATLPNANSREEAEQRQFINFDDDEAL